MSTANISLNCPQMSLTRTGVRHWLTGRESMSAQIDFDDGSSLTLSSVVIPPTPVDVRLLDFRPDDPQIATVEACEGEGADDLGNALTVNLPQEPVVIQDGGLVAKAIPAEAILHRADGSVWSGTVMFPDCPVTGGAAAPVTATGTLTEQ